MPNCGDLTDIALQDCVRALLVSGKLPADKASAVWAGSGNNEQCSICRTPIRPEEIAFDLLFSGARGEIELHMHRRCNFAWERERFAASASAVSPSVSP